MAATATACLSAGPAFASPDVWRTLLFGGIGGGTAGDLFVYTGFHHAPSGTVDGQGFLIRVFGGTGRYDYVTGGRSVDGRVTRAEALAGWQWAGSGARFALLGGIDMQHHDLSPPDPGNRVAGTYVGARLHAEVAGTLVPGWFGYAMASGSTANRNWSLYAKIAGRWPGAPTSTPAFSEVELGPEFAASGDRGHDQWRAGFRLGGVRIGALRVGLASGYVRNTRRGATDRDGIYGSIDAWTKF